MIKRETIMESAAVIVTVGLLAGVALAVPAYQRHNVAREAAGAQVVELYASAQRGIWSQEPLLGWNSFFEHVDKRPIRVRAGVPVLFRVTSIDVHHSFSIPELGVTPKDITPGRWTEVRVDAQDRGSTFDIICYTVCGMKHTTMDAELQVY